MKGGVKAEYLCWLRQLRWEEVQRSKWTVLQAHLLDTVQPYLVLKPAGECALPKRSFVFGNAKVCVGAHLQ